VRIRERLRIGAADLSAAVMPGDSVAVTIRHETGQARSHTVELTLAEWRSLERVVQAREALQALCDELAQDVAEGIAGAGAGDVLARLAPILKTFPEAA
jgi:hypothetical protein